MTPQMRAVCRAAATRLNREVAIKVLPEGLAADPDRPTDSHAKPSCWPR